MSTNSLIPTVGIHHNIPAEVYHSWQALSHSWLSRLRISPAHLFDLMTNGPDGSTSSQAFGTAVHCAVLERDTFDTRYAVRPEGQNGVTKEGKAFKAEAEATGRAVLSHEEGRWCEAVARRARENRRVSEWLARPHDTEVSIVWERGGYLCKARLDMMVPGINIIADLKTTFTADPDGFARQITKYHYHTQGAWYAEGLRAVTGQDWTFNIIAVEKRRPFLVTVHELVRGDAAHSVAVTECDKLFMLYTECCKAGHWPGYGDIFPITLPEWAMVESGEQEESFE